MGSNSPSDLIASDECLPDLRLQRRRPQGAIIDVLERHSHNLRGAIDRHVAEELKAERRRQILALLLGRRLDEGKLRSERVVEDGGSEGAGVDRA